MPNSNLPTQGFIRLPTQWFIRNKSSANASLCASREDALAAARARAGSTGQPVYVYCLPPGVAYGCMIRTTLVQPDGEARPLIKAPPPKVVERPWCGAPRELGGQQLCPIETPCELGTCTIGGRVTAQEGAQ